MTTNPGRDVAASSDDWIDRVGPSNTQAAVLRDERPDVKATMQACFQALLGENVTAGPPRIERLALAARVALLNGDEDLACRYRADLVAEHPNPAAIAVVTGLGSPIGPTALEAMLRFADTASLTPDISTPADITELTDKGFTPEEIVVITQIIGLTHLQCRVRKGLQLLGAAE